MPRRVIGIDLNAAWNSSPGPRGSTGSRPPRTKPPRSSPPRSPSCMPAPSILRMTAPGIRPIRAHAALVIIIDEYADWPSRRPLRWKTPHHRRLGRAPS